MINALPACLAFGIIMLGLGVWAAWLRVWYMAIPLCLMGLALLGCAVAIVLTLAGKS